MAANINPWTVNEFSATIIASFAPDLQPGTVSTLRLVSKKFRDVFTRDYYYRSYLRFLDKPHIYGRDLEKIGNVEDRWKQCLEMEKSRFDNWRKGTPSRLDTVLLPDGVKQRSPDFGGFLEGLINREHEYWMLIQCYDNKIALLNYSEIPISEVHDMNQYNVTLSHRPLAQIAPGQFFIGFDTEFYVFNYSKDDDGISLALHFKVDSRKNTLMISKESGVAQEQRNNLLLNYDELHEDRILRLWDCGEGKEMESINLKEFESLKKAFTSEICSMRVSKGVYPDLFIVTVETADFSLRCSKISKFNMESRQLTHLIGRIENLTEYSFNDKYACLILHDKQSMTDTLKVYDHKAQRPRKSEPRAVFQSQFSSMAFNNYGELVRLAETVLQVSYRNGTVRITSLDGSEILQRECKVKWGDKRGHVSTVIGPFWLVDGPDSSKTFDDDGEELFDWNNVTKQLKRNGHVHGIELPKNIEHMQNISKIVMCNGDGGLEIVNF